MKRVVYLFLLSSSCSIGAMRADKSDRLLSALSQTRKKDPQAFLYRSRSMDGTLSTHQLAAHGTLEQLKKLLTLAKQQTRDPRLPAYLRVLHQPSVYVHVRDDIGDLPVDLAATSNNMEACMYLFQTFHHRDFPTFRSYHEYLKVYSSVVERGYQDLLQRLFDVGHPFFLLINNDQSKVFSYTGITRYTTEARICNYCRKLCRNQQEQARISLTWLSDDDVQCFAHIHTCSKKCREMITCNINRSIS